MSFTLILHLQVLALRIGESSVQSSKRSCRRATDGSVCSVLPLIRTANVVLPLSHTVLTFSENRLRNHSRSAQFNFAASAGTLALDLCPSSVASARASGIAPGAELRLALRAVLPPIPHRMAGVWDYGDADDIKPLTDSSGK